MPNIKTQPQPNPPTGPNGDANVEAETDPAHKYPKYKLEDFSQQRINRGQQQINYYFVEVNEKIVAALNQLKTALRANSATVNLGPVETAINEVSAATDK